MSALEKQVSPTIGSMADAQAGSGLGDTSQLPDPADEKLAVASPANSSDVAVEPKMAEPSVAAELGKSKTAFIMSALCIAVFLAALDNTIITTAAPTIAVHYHASQADYTWIGSSYLLAAAAATPIWGKISDVWGRKPILLLVNAIFFVGSLIAALSTSIRMLVAGRAIQGMGGGGLLILANICISDLFSMRDRGKYFGMIGGVWGVASATGPVLGGVFTEEVSWRWCFYINLPLDFIAFVIILFLLDIETPKTPLVAGLKAIDWLGCLTVVSGTIMFLLGLEYGGVSYPWDSATVICLIVFGLFTIGLFFLNEWKLAKYPIMPLRIFKYRSNIASLVVCFCHGTVFIGGAFFLPLYFQSVFGATPILSGVYLFPFVLSLSFTSAVVGVFIKKTGQYLPAIWFGTLLATLGTGLFIDLPSGRHSWARIILFQIVAGIGAGPNFQSPLIALQTKIHPRDIATATATFGFTRQISTSMSVVIGGVIVQNGMHSREDTLRAALDPSLASALANGGAGAGTAIVGKLAPAERIVATRVYTDSLKMMWVFYVCIAAVGFVASLFIQKQTLNKQHEVQKTGLAEQERARKERKSENRLRRSMASPERKSEDRLRRSMVSPAGGEKAEGV